MHARSRSRCLRFAAVVLPALAAATAAFAARADPQPQTALPVPRVQVAVQGADDAEHYVARQVAMGYFDAAAAARRVIAPGRAAEVEIWLTPNDRSRYRAWVNLGTGSFTVQCPPEDCHTPYDLGKRVAAEMAARQSDLATMGVANGR